MNDNEKDIKGFDLEEFLGDLKKSKEDDSINAEKDLSKEEGESSLDETAAPSDEEEEKETGEGEQELEENAKPDDASSDDGAKDEEAAEETEQNEDAPDDNADNANEEDVVGEEIAADATDVSDSAEYEGEMVDIAGGGEKKSRKGLYITLATVFAFLAVLGGVYAFLSRPLSDAKKEEIYANGVFSQGVSVFDVDVGGDTIEQARNKLSGKVNFSADQTLLELKLKDKVIPVKASDLNITNTMDAVLKDAMLFGKEGHLLRRIMDRIDAKKNGKNFDVAIYTDEESLNTLVDTIVKNNSIEAKDAEVAINPNGGERFTFTPEQVGYEITPDGLAEKIKNHIENRETGYIDLDYKETEPKIKEADLKKNMVLRASYSTNVSGATGRRKNIMKAAEKINGKKVMPGEEFNIEHELGPRNAANGWSVGGEFVNGELVSGYGGGICQASTTLFNAVIRADLEVIKRSNHSQTVGYVPLGFDATISSGGPYFIWKNNTEYPIFIFANATMSKISIELYGAPLPYGDNISYEELVSASGTVTSGRRVNSALVFKKDGKEVHRISWSSSYRGKPVKVTTKKTTAVTAAAPPPTQAPTQATAAPPQATTAP